MRTISVGLALLVAGGCKSSEPKGEYIGPSSSKPVSGDATAATLSVPATKTSQTPAASITSPASPSGAAVPLGSNVPMLRDPDVIEIDDKTTLAEAIAYAKPRMGDIGNDETWDRGSFLLGQWLSTHAAWGAIQALPETSLPKVLKDSEGERGSRYCESGQVITIKALKSSGAKMFWGVIASSETRATAFFAAGSTGNIVNGSPARICGVITGTYTLSLKSGAPLPAAKIVGMFDLPENKKKK